MVGLRTFENIIDPAKGKYVMGTSLSYVDLALVVRLLELELEVPDWVTKLNLPHLHALADEVTSMPSYQAYESSGRRMPFFVPDAGGYGGAAVSKEGMQQYFDAITKDEL
eukprot:gnl/TRDRNA2_/TRDRNA2_134397_c0_seq2.p1 gnl/TRDRNA2_/TRDRNA2_134397_c0~~gnl/TRDRNA2_/TRDRNA2_134397_c0_seq2.p1  ORF type:complete len:110 (+),score=23.63 gnl/TRDRNA2_/TRDRNA2_134397_c0_seq2:53-382(+)